MSPLRYQKWLRLNEVRRQMLNEHYDVTTAAYAVGYESYPISVGNATGENVSLGTVNKSKVPLGLSATYGQTGNKVSAGTVQSVIGVTFIYE